MSDVNSELDELRTELAKCETRTHEELLHIRNTLVMLRELRISVNLGKIPSATEVLQVVEELESNLLGLKEFQDKLSSILDKATRVRHITDAEEAALETGGVELVELKAKLAALGYTP